VTTRDGLPAEIRERDDVLTEAFDAALAVGVRRAGRHLACRRGCTPCCVGSFDITALDAARLRRGLQELASAHPRVAAAVRRRAAEQWRTQRPAYPGGAAAGILAEDEVARERFFAAFADAPCPALDPHSGACVLYRFRPLSCRSYGLPVRCGGAVLEPCPLNFTRASAAEIAAAVVEPDPDDSESALLAALLAHDPSAGDTTVAAALAGGE